MDALLAMELRNVAAESRTIVGVVVPYDEVSYLTPGGEGERVRRGAFRRSLDHRGDRIPLLRNHARDRTLGRSQSFTETDDGLVGAFVVNDGPHGDELLDDVRHGYLEGMSVGFQAVRVERAPDGVREVREARLVEVSMVGIPAYEGAAMLAVRSAETLSDLLAPFTNRPAVNLAPIPPVWR